MHSTNHTFMKKFWQQDMHKKITSGIHLISIISTLSLLHDAAASVAKPNCPDKCGNLTVPYPFGIGKGCYLRRSFEVKCNTSSYPASFPTIFDTKVYEIAQHHVIVHGDLVIPFVYNKSSGESEYMAAPYSVSSDDLTDDFSVSHTENQFVAIGCDIYAYITDIRTSDIVSGCPSLCKNSSISPMGSSSYCSGKRCCRDTIPKDLIDMAFYVQTMNTWDRSWESDPCSFAMVVHKDFSDFNKFNLSDCAVDSHRAPLALDWGIGNISCHEAIKNGTCICGQNSECINSSRGVGYSCRCLTGYQGNPYLHDGCQDINECGSPEKNECPQEARCVNTPGSYHCTCPPGYHKGRNFGPSSPHACLPDRARRAMLMFISLGIGLAAGFLILVSIFIWVHRKLKRIEEEKAKKRFFKTNGGLLLQQQPSSSQGSLSETKLFVTQELEKATDNFNESRILGQGGLGTVYKGMLSDGTIVAVKKSNKIDQCRVSQFINEVVILSQINHRHIVKLLGCCLETEVPLLVYEYVSNGTLSQHLHDDPGAGMINWENRLRIAAEVAEALAYLHSYASTAIFHRDIKSSNILLDENYRAVVSDFGLSRSVPIDKTHLTTLVGGTFGYLDPEYFRSGQLNDKSDVYAFGVVLAELLTGQKAVSSDKSDEGLVIRFREAVKENRLFETLDKMAADEGLEEEILAVVRLTKRCLKLNARKRPSTREIATVLEQLRIKEGSIARESLQDGYCSLSERSYCCNVDSITEDSLE
ncbi:wall-associated receptor kinase 5 [Coffea arabica]|uniref:Wall-associated receptor kinase 5 n=1 Tax=Coffea arabica TaxID=13443 RepID=A0A6P6UC32_COFAR|nr:wall-associated receptor kinase 5-like [Coffea arabica]